MAGLINIAKDFSPTPGSRYRWEGPSSGEQFREEQLEPAYKEAVKAGTRLEIDFDGSYGYATSFLEESFGGLARIYGEQTVLNLLRLTSTEEPNIIEEVRQYIRDATLPETKKRREEKARRRPWPTSPDSSM